ncbi:MAG: phenylalanine--tRNA ligase subunit alpha [Candidatus Kerfeldbacteria bacterium]
MERDLVTLRDESLAAIVAATDAADLKRIESSVLGRNGSFTLLMKRLPEVPVDDRPRIGKAAQDAKRTIEQALEERRRSFGAKKQMFDPTLPGERPLRGHQHPLTRYTRRMLEVWRSFGYDVHEGPELEKDWFNFEALNIPKDHPSRDIQDTFFIKGYPDLVLRTHTSTVQLRSVFFHRKPPLKCVEIGHVYRHEATDAKHESMFTQCDGIALDRHLTMAHLVGTLTIFLKTLFGKDTKIRVRPSYFPFVEPGIEIDMQWTVNGKTTWLEMLGAGMVHPNVLKSMKLDPKAWRGFAFGMGVDRLMMLDSGISDIRLSYSGNLDFLTQF